METGPTTEISIAARVLAHIQSGGDVQITTYTRSTYYKGSKHADMFRIGKDGNLYVQHGRSWNCLTSMRGTHSLVTIYAYA